MKRLALVAVAALTLAIALAAPAIPENSTAKFIPPEARCLLPAFEVFSAKVWAPKHWERGDPPQSTIDAAHRRIGCAPSASHRTAMKHTWRRDRAAFYKRRRYELSWRTCPVEIRAASEAYGVSADLLYGIEGAESSHLGGNWFGLLAGAEGVDVSDRAASAMQAARLMRRLHDELGSWPAAMWAYSGGSYDISHPYALSGDVCP